MKRTALPHLRSRYWFSCRLAEQLAFGQNWLPTALPQAIATRRKSAVSRALVEQYERRKHSLVEALIENEFYRFQCLFPLRDRDTLLLRPEVQTYVLDTALERVHGMALTAALKDPDEFSPKRSRAFRPRRCVQVEVMVGAHMINGGTNYNATARLLNDGVPAGENGIEGHHIGNAVDTFWNRLCKLKREDADLRISLVAVQARVAEKLWPRVTGLVRSNWPVFDVIEAFLETGELLRWHDDLMDVEPLLRPLGLEIRPLAQMMVEQDMQRTSRAAKTA